MTAEMKINTQGLSTVMSSAVKYCAYVCLALQ